MAEDGEKAAPAAAASAAAAAEGAGGAGKGGGEEERSVKLFVGQVPKHMTEAELLALFREVAAVDEVTVIKDKVTKVSRGCCFLICPSREEADKAVNAYHNKRTLPGASSPLQVKYADGELERLEHKLFIGMLPKNVTDTELTDLFSKYGNIKDLQILRGSQQTSKAGCAFLKYETKEQALAAIEDLNGKHKIEGSSVPLVVKWADTEKERQARKAQKAQLQLSNMPSASPMQQSSLFGALQMGYMPQYNGFGYQPPGTYGLMQYPLSPMQNQGPFQNMVQPVNQGNSIRGVNPELSPSSVQRSFNAMQLGSPYPAIPGMQYPGSYPGGLMNNRPFGNSHNSIKVQNSNANSTISSSPSSNAGGQVEGSLVSANHSRTKYKNFEGNHTNLRIKEVDVQHSTLYSDLESWLAMGELRQNLGFHHSCLQQASQQLHVRDDIKKLIRDDILLKTNDRNNCTVICVISESGLGKTSLLHALYNDRDLLDNFDNRIWIQMSSKFDREILFRKIIEFPTHAPCTITNLSFLEEMVKETLVDKRSMIFLDDAEIEDQHFWTNVLEVLNAGAKGSAVVVATTYGTSGALTAGATHSYCLGPLSEENNLMLFEQYAVKGHDIKSYPELVSIAKKFIARFGGNPLNLKALGGLLRHKDTVMLEQDKLEGNIISCLHICHDVLPEYLKNCLAFCSLFPKGYIFDRHRTVLLWLSQDFVAPVVGREPEDVAIEYFNELLCRSFFQYSPSHDYKDNKFVMHELIYNVVASVSRNKYFQSEDLVSSIPENTLHLSLVSSQFQNVELMSKTEKLKDLRTFLVVQPEWQQYKISFPTLNLVGLDNFFLKFTSLQTLDLNHTGTEELPGSIASLRNLQYLSVSNTSIRSLPSELCSLGNLQTLEAKDCRLLTELPGDTKKLLKLRHLDVTKELDYVQLPHGIGHLTGLRTLPVFHASGDPSRCSISELRNLNNLRGCLRLSGLEIVKTGSKAQEANLKNKHHLKDLTLQWHDGGIEADDEDEDEDTENVAEQVLQILQPHTNLQELAIRGYEGNSFPDWMQGSSSLPNLVSLTLDGCCNCTEFPAISQLPSLKFLSVRKMYCVQRLINNNIHGSTIKFPSLELLNLWEMYGLEELFESFDGDCPRLRKVCLSRCPDLKKLPCIRSVTELVLHCGRELPDIPDLASLASLKIEGFHGVKSFSLPSLPLLKKVEIRSCKELVSVDGLSVLTTVQRLKISGCPKLVLPTTGSSLPTNN